MDKKKNIEEMQNMDGIATSPFENKFIDILCKR